MKTTSLLIALTIVAGTAWSAPAADQVTTPKTTKPVVVEKAKTKKATKHHHKQAVTGSYIPRYFRESGVITDGPSPLYIINASAIARTGAADLSQALIRTGFRR